MLPGTDAIVVNTGPIIALAACQEIDLLRRLHSRVLVPPQVVEEFQHGPAAQRAILPDWFEVRSLAKELDTLLVQHLDIGEASAIALAVQERVPLLVMDERRGRMVARSVGLAVTGSLGILLRAKRLGFIEAISPRLDAMRAGGVWLASALTERVLQEANER